VRIEQRLAPTPQYPPGWLVGQLPVGMRDDDLLVRFTTIFERLGATLRAGADGIEHAVDPTVTTPQMLVFMGRWLGYDLLDAELPIERQRRIIAALGRALRLRGTVAGLRILLEAVTDGPVEIDEPGGVLGDADVVEATPAVGGTEPDERAGRIQVRLSSSGHLREHELAELVRDEVPAHLQVEVVFVSAEGERA